MKKYKVIVCGTNFGKFYISALLKKNDDFILSGIFAKGSNRSRAIAEELDIPLYTKVADIPDEIDIACVVVKSTILGGMGTSLAVELLKRKINVIQEHPVHFSDISLCIKAAAENGVCYHVNSHFVNVKPIKVFMDYVKLTIEKERPLFIDVTTSLIYSTIDILCRILGEPESFEFLKPIEWDEKTISIRKTDFLPFKCLQGVIAGIPVTFKLQNYFDPDDLDQNYLIMHRLCIGSESGNTALMSSHGPVIWTQGYPVPLESSANENNEDSFRSHKEKYSGYTQPSFVVFSESAGPSYSDVTSEFWPEAILDAIDIMRKNIENGVKPFWQEENYLKKISSMWIEVMKSFGKPEYLKIDKLENTTPDPYQYYETLKSQNI